jgi:transposase
LTIELPETAKRKHAITINVVLAHEENPPDGEEAVSWTLLTTLPTKTIGDIKKVVDYYRARWVIEEFFKVLKSGCAIEKLQLETAERLKRAITLYMIIAYRVLFMVKVGRESPDVPCDAIFEEEEWKTIYMARKKERPPKIIPRLMEIVKMVAMYGGFKGRKCDGFPGAKTVWIGLGIIRGYLIVKEDMEKYKLC